ncbi:hypothetical protein DSECCO2_208350 [anaerobic digester metagenome]|jgi:uncharacterized membrane protein YsdA (DUF1294 family)|nr:DUF1294 domain-containing protein [Methanomassiliicoccales archaeon]
MDWTSAAFLALAGLYLLINLVAMMMYAYDKMMARRGDRRISEKTLLLMALLGPFGAMAGMRWFRHKTRKLKFKLVPLFALVHVLIVFLLLY